LGKYEKPPRESGLYFLFPFFTKVRAQVLLSEQMMKLYMDETVTVGYGGGQVDFKDGSAPVDAFVYFQIVDAYKAIYNISNAFKALEENMDGSIRSYLSNYSIDQANRLKVQFDLKKILNGDIADTKGVFPPSTKELKDILAWNYVFEKWGIEIKKVVISDILLTEKQKAIRETLQAAEKEIEVAEAEVKKAKFKKQKTIIEADGAKEAAFRVADAENNALKKKGEGLAQQVGLLKAAGVEPTQIVAHLAERIKWEKVGDKTVIVDSGASVSGLSAQFAAIMEALKQSKP
jgi:regulator of protease activity HflC (stomatin/prohibitin superfamily)